MSWEENLKTVSTKRLNLVIREADCIGLIDWIDSQVIKHNSSRRRIVRAILKAAMKEDTK